MAETNLSSSRFAWAIAPVFYAAFAREGFREGDVIPTTADGGSRWDRMQVWRAETVKSGGVFAQALHMQHVDARGKSEFFDTTAGHVYWAARSGDFSRLQQSQPAPKLANSRRVLDRMRFWARMDWLDDDAACAWWMPRDPTVRAHTQRLERLRARLKPLRMHTRPATGLPDGDNLPCYVDYVGLQLRQPAAWVNEQLHELLATPGSKLANFKWQRHGVLLAHEH